MPARQQLHRDICTPPHNCIHAMQHSGDRTIQALTHVAVPALANVGALGLLAHCCQLQAAQLQADLLVPEQWHTTSWISMCTNQHQLTGLWDSRLKPMYSDCGCACFRLCAFSKFLCAFARYRCLFCTLQVVRQPTSRGHGSSS